MTESTPEQEQAAGTHPDHEHDGQYGHPSGPDVPEDGPGGEHAEEIDEN